jgi:hypothetical protein
LLALIKNVTAPSFSSEEEEVRRLKQWAHGLLRGVRDYWNRTNASIPTHDLATFFELSIHTIPLLAAPDLRASWDAIVNDALSQIAKPDYYTSFLSLTDFWEACALIRENEPRFLKHIGFPDDVVHVGERALEEFESYLDGDPSPSDRQEYEEEIGQAESFQEHAAAIAEHFPALAPRAKKLISSANYAKNRFNEALEEGVPERRSHDSPIVRPMSPSLTTSTSTS